MNIGETIKTAREKHNISLEEVQEKTKIRTRYLKAIENNNFEVIPGRVYARAFLKEYAGLLGLDIGEILNEFETNFINNNKPQIEIKQKTERINNGFNNIQKIIILIIIIVIIAVPLYIKYYKKTESELITTMENTTSQVINNKKETVTESKETVSKKSPVQIIATDRSWLHVRTGDNELYKGFINKGEKMKFDVEKRISIKIGNAAGIKIKINDMIKGPWGEEGEVIEKEFQIKK